MARKILDPQSKTLMLLLLTYEVYFNSVTNKIESSLQSLLVDMAIKEDNAVNDWSLLFTTDL